MEKRTGCLVLSRKTGEGVMIGDDVEVFVVDIRGDKVRLGFRGPKEVRIHRREIFEAIEREKEATL
jgi:carbon storage regulator